mmetsp:Transcript_136838/g.381446  ORF Transcript_136838/g.381446 Transcript_136838/m.381446 type:complete len:255 (-) Transcript_136838:26-790(-)
MARNLPSRKTQQVVLQDEPDGETMGQFDITHRRRRRLTTPLSLTTAEVAHQAAVNAAASGDIATGTITRRPRRACTTGSGSSAGEAAVRRPFTVDSAGSSAAAVSTPSSASAVDKRLDARGRRDFDQRLPELQPTSQPGSSAESRRSGTAPGVAVWRAMQREAGTEERRRGLSSKELDAMFTRILDKEEEEGLQQAKRALAARAAIDPLGKGSYFDEPFLEAVVTSVCSQQQVEGAPGDDGEVWPRALGGCSRD